jgi:hypothetical protein
MQGGGQVWGVVTMCVKWIQGESIRYSIKESMGREGHKQKVGWGRGSIQWTTWGGVTICVINVNKVMSGVDYTLH